MDIQTFDRLYLARNCEDSRQDIYVDRCPVVEHQLNGIRYLYKAWVKKKPGVILNDPSGYGKRVQTALFLSAVLPTLAKPVLILCREGSEKMWMSYFQEWTKISNDVCIEQTNPQQTKKKVLISTTNAAVAFSKREWSVLVVDHDALINNKQTLKADTRVWITSSPIKEDLAKFSSFCSWVYKDLNDVLITQARLEAFMEDVVLRRDLSETPFPKSQISNSKNILEEQAKVARITKKNKDATGTKIKRSKRKSMENAIENVPNKVSRITKIKNTTENNTETFEIGNFVNEKTTKHIDEKLQAGDKKEDIDDENFAPLNRKSKNKSLWDSEGSGDEQVNEPNNPREDKSQYKKEDHSQSHESGREGNVCGNFRLKKSMPESPQANHEIINTEVDVKDLDNSGSLVNDENHIESLYNNDKIMDEVNPVKYKKISDLFSTDLTTNNEIKVKTIVYETESAEDNLPVSPNNLRVEKIVYETESVKDDIPISPNNLNVKEMENELIEINNTTVDSNISSFETKMKELEQRMMKKYKGSVLDMF